MCNFESQIQKKYSSCFIVYYYFIVKNITIKLGVKSTYDEMTLDSVVQKQVQPIDNTLQRYSQSRRTACRCTERGLEVVLYGGSPLTFFRSAGNGR